MNFRVHAYAWRCKQCGTSEDLVQFGITSTGELAFMWHCKKCNEEVMCNLSVEEVLAEAPAPLELIITEDDLKLMEGMHFKL